MGTGRKAELDPISNAAAASRTMKSRVMMVADGITTAFLDCDTCRQKSKISSQPGD